MNFNSFDLNLLRVLDALLREGSTVAAGRAIGMSQPAVSAALGRLRHSLGDPLFVRSGQGLEPTDFARSIAEPLADTLAQIEHVLEPSRFDPMTAKDTFTISSSDLFSLTLMPILARNLPGLAPNVTIKFLELFTTDYTSEVASGRADIALIPDRNLPDFAEKKFLFNSPSIIIARTGNERLQRAGLKAGDTVPLDLFCDLPQAFYAPSGSEVGVADQALSKLGRKRRIAMTLGTFSALMQTVAASELIAVIPQYLAEHQADQLGLMQLELPFDLDPARVVIAWHKRSTDNPAHIWFRELIAEMLT